MAHYCLPELKKTKGPIVNIGSKVAETGQGDTASYTAANCGRNALTREWAVELAKYGIQVNAVVVAKFYTTMYENWIKTLLNSEEPLEEINNRIPLGNRITTVDEIANSVFFLLFKRSSHSTRQLIHVDGGYVHLDWALLKR